MTLQICYWGVFLGRCFYQVAQLTMRDDSEVHVSSERWFDFCFDLFKNYQRPPPTHPPPTPTAKKKRQWPVQGEPEPCASVALHCGRGGERLETCLVIPNHHVRNTRAKVPQAIAALSFLYFRTMSDSVVPVNACIVVLPDFSMGDRSAVRPRNLSSLIKGFVGDWERARCGRWEDNHTVGVIFFIFFRIAAGILETPDFVTMLFVAVVWGHGWEISILAILTAVCWNRLPRFHLRDLRPNTNWRFGSQFACLFDFRFHSSGFRFAAVWRNLAAVAEAELPGIGWNFFSLSSLIYYLL